MKERSLYFRNPSADAMVRAVLAGTKTQHRVPVKTPVPSSPPELDWLYPNVEPSRQSYGYWLMGGVACISPFGGPGDRIRIKEAFCIEHEVDGNVPPHNDGRPVRYSSDHDDCLSWEQPHYRATDPTPQLGYQDSEESGPCVRWRPSSHMPRWACRIIPVVKRVWIEHVQDISEADSRLEGLWDMQSEDGLSGWGAGPPVPPYSGYTYRNTFRHQWDSIYASKGYGWSENPGVWACEFESER